MFLVLCVALSGFLLVDFELFGKGFDLVIVFFLDVHDFGQFGGYGSDEDILECLDGLICGMILVLVEFYGSVGVYLCY